MPDTTATSADLHWYAARTRFGCEVGIRNRLTLLGVEHFIPMKERKATRGSRIVETPVVPSLVFFRSTREKALELVHFEGIKADFITDCATRRMLIVPDKQMEDFRRVFDYSKDAGGLLDENISLGDEVVVARGPLTGVEGRIVEIKGKSYVAVALLGSVFARAKVPRAWLNKAN